MSCGNINKIYKEVKERNLKAGLTEEEFMAKWLNALAAKRSGTPLRIVKYIQKHHKDGKIAGSFNQTKRTTAHTFLDIREVDGEYVVFTDSGNYTFEQGKNRSKPTQSGKVKYFYAPVMELTGEMVYGNEPDAKEPRDVEYGELKEEIWKDQKAALKLFDRMEELDGKTEHTAYLRKLLNKITDPQKKILNEFKTYINEEAEQNFGIATVIGNSPKLELNITSEGMTANGMSRTEMYVHEMIHMSVEAARLFKKGPLLAEMREMRRMWRIAKENVTVEDLVENGDVTRAEKTWNYLFENEETGLAEFIAYAMTNEKLKGRLRKLKSGKDKIKIDKSSVWNVVSTSFIRVLQELEGMVRGIGSMFGVENKEKMQVDERVAWLVSRMWDHNNQTAERTRMDHKIQDAVQEKQQKVDKKLVDGVRFISDTVGVGVEWAKGVKGPVGQTATVAQALGRFVNPYTDSKRVGHSQAVYSDWLKHMEGNMLVHGLGRLIGPESSVRGMLDWFRETDDEARSIEQMGLMVNKMDKAREDMIRAVGKDILEALGKTDKHQQTALTKALIETDIKAVWKEYGVEGIKEMMENDTAIQDKIVEKMNKLEGMVNGRQWNYMKAQSRGLGFYMVTGKGDSTLELNAVDIVNQAIELEGAIKKKEEVIKLVDEITSLEALLNADASAKATTAQMMTDKADAVEMILSYHTMHTKDDQFYRMRHEIREPMVKGEIKDLSSESIAYKLAGNSEADKKRMKQYGYKYVGNSQVDGIGMYKKNTAGMAGFNKQAVAKINEAKKMHTLIDIKAVTAESATESFKETAKDTLKKMEERKAKIAQQMRDGEMGRPDGLRAIRNKYGEVTNFGVTIDNELYADAMQQDKRAPVLLAKMIAEIDEKDRAGKHNIGVMEYILKDMQKNYHVDRENTTKQGIVNRREYIELGPDAKNFGKVETAFADETWNDMPEQMRRMVYTQPKGQRYIAVRRDQVPALFGRRSPSILNLRIPFTKRKIDKNDRSIEQLLNQADLGWMVEAVKVAGDIWQEVGGLTRVAMVIKTPKVLWDNYVSILAYSVALGQAPWDVAARHKALLLDLRDYLKTDEELLRLENKRKRGMATDEDRQKIRTLRQQLKENSMKPIMDMGGYSSVIEDVNMYDLKSHTRLDKLRDKMPKIMQDGFNIAYVTEETGLYKALMMSMVQAEVIGQANRYYYLIEKGYSKQEAWRMSLDEKINYNKLMPSKTFQWLKDMNFAQFLTFRLGATKSLLEKAKTNPTSLLMMWMTDIPNPTEGFMFQDNTLSRFTNPWDIVTDQVPQYVLNPSLVRNLAGFVD